MGTERPHMDTEGHRGTEREPKRARRAQSRKAQRGTEGHREGTERAQRGHRGTQSSRRGTEGTDGHREGTEGYRARGYSGDTEGAQRGIERHIKGTELEGTQGARG